MLNSWHDLVVALAGAIVGGILTYLGAFLLSKQTAAATNAAVCEQLAMLMRALEAKLIIRRDHDATPIGGYDVDLKRLLDRAVSTDASVAIPKDQVRRFYVAMTEVENAVISISYSKAMMETKNNPAYLQPMRDAAKHACDELREARALLGDTETVSDPVSKRP